MAVIQKIIALSIENLYLYKETNMRNGLYALILSLVLLSCKEKKIDLSGEVPLKKKEFFSAFRTMTLPYLLSDTNLKSAADTIKIGHKAFKQFFPDSIFQKITGNNKQLIFQPVGLIKKEKEHYYLLLCSLKKKQSLIVIVTGADERFLAFKELLNNYTIDEYKRTLSINKEPTFLLSKEKTDKDNKYYFTRSGWAYNDAGVFMVVITDTNEDPVKNAVINPLDTMPKKNLFSGDYIKDKNNYISVRDGVDPGHYEFFIHFEKNNGNCNGELKGTLSLTGKQTGIFRESGDPCVIDFNFDNKELKVKEQGSCGNYRGIKCLFNDTYIRKKEKSKPKRK